MKYFAAAVAVGVVIAAGAAFAVPATISGTVSDTFGSRFVLETEAGKVLVDIGPKGSEKVTVKRGEKIQIEGDRVDNQLRARRVTMADGSAFVVDKRGRSWREWLLGKAPESAAQFGPALASKIATDKGYQVSGEPVAKKKHYEVLAAKDGKTYDLKVYRDGKIDQEAAFKAAEARKLAVDKGYEVTTDPLPVKRHFRVVATKGGKPVEVDLHRDGRIVERAAFGAADAQRLVTGQGYEQVGEPRMVDQHFELLGKKDGKYFELHAHRDGRLVRARPVELGDPKWGSVIR